MALSKIGKDARSAIVGDIDLSTKTYSVVLPANTDVSQPIPNGYNTVFIKTTQPIYIHTSEITLPAGSTFAETGYNFILIGGWTFTVKDVNNLHFLGDTQCRVNLEFYNFGDR